MNVTLQRYGYRNVKTTKPLITIDDGVAIVNCGKSEERFRLLDGCHIKNGARSFWDNWELTWIDLWRLTQMQREADKAGC